MKLFKIFITQPNLTNFFQKWAPLIYQHIVRRFLGWPLHSNLSRSPSFFEHGIESLLTSVLASYNSDNKFKDLKLKNCIQKSSEAQRTGLRREEYSWLGKGTTEFTDMMRKNFHTNVQPATCSVAIFGYFMSKKRIFHSTYLNIVSN